MRSHQLADAAWNEGFYDDLTRGRAGDGGHPGRVDPARDRTSEKLATLTPVVPGRGDHHGGQRLAAQRRRLGRGARLPGGVRRGSVDCRWPGSPAARPPRSSRRCSGTRRSRRPSRRCGGRESSWSDIGAVELNEAFAVQSLACVDAWGVDPEIVNAKGGRDRDRPSAGRLGRPHPRDAGQADARRRVTGGASRRSASASARASRSCSRTRTRDVTGVGRHGPGRGGGGDRGRVDGAGRWVRDGGYAGRPDRCPDPAGGVRPHGGVQQRRERRHGVGGSVGGGAGAEDDLLVPASVGLVGVRRVVPGRGGRPGGGAAGEPGGADAGGWRGDRCVLLSDGRGDAVGGGQGDADDRR